MYTLKIIDSIRQKAISLIKATPLEVLNQVPAGFNNNIIWNFGHLVVSGYGLVFKVTQVDPGFVIPLLDAYKKGSRPAAPATQQEVDELIALSGTFTLAVKEALDANRFREISTYTTDTFGVPVTTIEEMLITVAAHDTLHWQSMRDYARIFNP
ncbi:DinB family protein [Niabella drilacis]|uniref:DinB superfamily protein n=1 Tax=Niabella drilacis (strain DSM 25811 / CCM 8410 / CCUG 62505 / LMG 26954 / E90) TaxID=1285928 RepID=A0A1G6SZ38_NIADE|nr:DinB family protein [Niabella drilacis]SDD22023.1 DinB superfamily protein [Niabella drilacis]